MSGLGASLALAIVVGWVVFALSGWAVSAPLATGFGLVIGLGVAFGLQGSMAVGGAVALLAPFGVMLPALVLRHVAMKLGVPMVPFSSVELLVFLAAYLVFLMTAFGVVPVDLYRFGYAPWPVAAMVLAVCAYGAVTGNWMLPLVAVLGQVFWVLGWGSSNWFDYVLHVLLVPVTVIVLVGRLF